MKNSFPVTSFKCPQCSLVNFATAEVCKRCGTALHKNEDANEHEPEPHQKSQVGAPATVLVPCPDCKHLCSRIAEACPSCGRSFELAPMSRKSSIGKVLTVAAIAGLCVSVVSIALVTQRATAVQSALRGGNPATAGISSANREAARAAMNAVSEIQSVTSVGANFIQYGSAIQNAKVKLDAAMRDFNPRDSADREIKLQLEEAFNCYVDARDAWAEFIEHDEYGYGFLDQNNERLKDLAKRYGFELYKSERMPAGEFYKSTVLQTIWARASEILTSVNEHVR